MLTVVGKTDIMTLHREIGANAVYAESQAIANEKPFRDGTAFETVSG